MISLMGVAQTRMAVITNLSKDNPKVKTMRRMNRLTVILAVALYFVPLIDNDFIVNIPTTFIFCGYHYAFYWKCFNKTSFK